MDIKREAERFRKNKDYNNAVALYEKLYTENKEECKQWEVWGYLYCLKQRKEYSKAIEICEKEISKYQDYSPFKNLYAWCLYYKEIAELQETEDKIGIINQIIELSGSDYKYSPLVLTIFHTAKILKNEGKYQQIVEMLSKIDKKNLARENREMTLKNGKKIVLASQLENYYNLLSESLLKTNKYEHCSKLCEEAISEISTFQNSGNIWMKRRWAKAYYHSDDFERAIKLYQEIIARKKDWFLYYEIAELYYKQGNYENALRYSVDSAKAMGDIDKKVNLYYLIGLLFCQSKKVKEAALCFKLSYIIRKKNSWSFSQELLLKIAEYTEMMKEIPDNPQDLLQELKGILNNIKSSFEQKYDGTIISMFPNGKAGFIKREDGKSFYYNTKSFVGKYLMYTVGSKVQFSLRDSYDKKKNLPSFEAIEINLKN